MQAKILLAAASAALMTTSGLAVPSQDSYHAVTNDWYNANFTNVLELAEARLAANSNDLAGTYLRLSWDICFSDIPTLTNSITRAVTLSEAVTNEAFSNDFQQLKPVMISLRDDFLPNMTEAERLAELPKARLPHKPIPERHWLKLLWDNGLWLPLQQNQ